MKMRIIEHPSFYRLLKNIVDEIPVKHSGTYDRADPTHFEKGDEDFDYKGIHFHLDYSDVTWGIEVEISKWIPAYPEMFPNPEITNKFYWRKQFIAGFYITHDREWNGKHYVDVKAVILRQKGTKGMIGLLARVYKRVLHPFFKSRKQLAYEKDMEEMEETWTDPAGGVHHGDEVDPAAMYI